MKSLDELAKVREAAKKITKLRDGNAEIKIVVGMGDCGITAGARETLLTFVSELESNNLNQAVVMQTGCLGQCKAEPVVEVFMPGEKKVVYGKVTAEVAKQIVASHVQKGVVVKEALLSAE